ncbi:MAG: ABC transporter substrate-binding protein [Anaerolineales bacterium]|jgi:peptide/nickel transport system substrate-binding protein|nr:ABC transporter substrate-binding protein [Anaerolineales bacterium]
MSRNRLMSVLGLLIIASMILSACGTSTEAPQATDAPAVATDAPAAATEAPVATEAPSTRMGGWLDEIVVSVVAKDSAVTQIEAGAIDVYASGLSSADLPSIQEAGLNYSKQNGLYYDMIYNPAEFTSGEFNPFSNRKIREATNWIVDRDYINQEIYAGGGLAKYLPITTQFPDYADLADVARELEAKYAYNLEKGKEVITAEMEGMGATVNAEGKFEIDGAPVTVIFLIRSDSDGTRQPLGDYFAAQLEAVGFTVDRQYGKSSELGPKWQGTAADGGWHIYTGAWSATIIDRDQRNMLQEMYLPSSAQGLDLMVANQADPEFLELGDKLANAEYNNLEERRAMMVRGLELALEDSLQLWLIDGKNYSPYGTNVKLTYDLAAGVEGAQVWPYTVRFAGEEGGQLKWATGDLFTEPWNPVAGSNWAWDQAIIRSTQSGDTMNDPFTGLLWPLRMERAEVTVVDGLPVGVTNDWVKLSFVPEIKVPEDAIVDWDATTQQFITSAEKFPEGQTAKRMSVAYYPADLFETVKWHDGSNLSMADIMLAWAMTFDRGKPESALYDEVYVANFEAFMSTFKGFRITSTEPLVFEVYSDTFSADAELNVGGTWPTYSFGEGSFAQIAIGNMAEANGELAYSIDKADVAEVEQMNFVGGPSLEILSGKLDQAIAESYIPFEPMLSQYITKEEAVARYENLKAFYTEHGHFWQGTGPYLLNKAFPTEKTLTLAHFDGYPDLANRWSGFTEPKLATAELDGPGQVKIGDEAIFDLFVNFGDAAYPQSEIKFVKFLLYNAKGEVVTVGEAVAVADGQYQIVLPADVTAKLEAGSNKLEVAVAPLTVAIPTFTSIEFVTAP